MWRIVFGILSITTLFLGGCTPSPGGQDIHIVRIEGYDEYGVHRRGHGFWMDPVTLLTAAHVIDDDRLQYRTESGRLHLVSRDKQRDIAVMSDAPQRPVSYHFPMTYTGATIWTRVWREGAWKTLTGKVLAPEKSVSGYDVFGRVRTIHHMVVTDLPVVAGDSGAPIVHDNGEVVGIVIVGE